MSSFDLQRIEISFALDFLLFDSLVAGILGTHVENTVVENSTLVLDLVVLHLHIRNSHGSLVLVCNGLAGLGLG